MKMKGSKITIIIILLFFVTLCLFSQEPEKCKFVLASYFDVLKTENRDILLEKLPKVESLYYYQDEHSEHFYEKTWTDYYDRIFGIQLIYNAFDITNFYSDKNKKGILIGDYSGYCFVIDSMKINKNEFIFTAHSNVEIDSSRIVIDFPKIKKDQNYELKIIIDGDYLELFINNMFVDKFCKINNSTLLEYEELIKNNSCDLSKVTWPRHADGTSEYDNKIITPEKINLFKNDEITYEIDKDEHILTKSIDKQEETSNQYNSEIRTVSVKKNKVMVITEDTVVRFDPYSNGTYMTSVVKGTTVKIKKVGKKDTINGVTSNWVFITFVGDAYNTKGKKIYYKTEGWLFGGVLD